MSEPRNRYEYGLLELCGRIHGAICGSADGIPDDDLRGLRDWLSWRISETEWHKSLHRDFVFYDRAVYALCDETLVCLETFFSRYVT